MPIRRPGILASITMLLILAPALFASAEARRLPLKGCAVVKFNIDANGAASNIILIKGSDPTISERLTTAITRVTLAPKEGAALPLRNQLLTFTAMPQPKRTDVYVTFGGVSPVFRECDLQKKYPPSSYRIVTKDYMEIFSEILT